jgi:hypothetical protein
MLAEAHHAWQTLTAVHMHLGQRCSSQPDEAAHISHHLGQLLPELP